MAVPPERGAERRPERARPVSRRHRLRTTVLELLSNLRQRPQGYGFRGFWRSEQREMGWGGSSTGPGSSCPASQAHPQLLQLHPKEVASSKNSVAPPRASNGKRPQAEKSWAQRKAPRCEDLQRIPGLLQKIPIINKARNQ
ncbi:uncharacterized protein [Patagioenas fasciata]|uniref:uncharacterized protein isoform X5 n=1 Tax=Patagioenas fasciata TaxID=372321 RepID=UPI003A9A53B1